MRLGGSLGPGFLVAFLAAISLTSTATASSAPTAAPAPLPAWDDCGFEPWDPVLNAPLEPGPAGSARSCAASGYFRVSCGEGPCAPLSLTHLPPMIHSERMEVVDGKCVRFGEVTFLYCTQIVELRLLPPACPRPASSRLAGGVVKTPDGINHISGERIRLTMDYDFSCGTFHCESDPQTEDDPTNPGHPLLCAPAAPRCQTAPCDLPPPAPFDL